MTHGRWRWVLAALLLALLPGAALARGPETARPPRPVEAASSAKAPARSVQPARTAGSPTLPGPSFLDTGLADWYAFEGLPPEQEATWLARARAGFSSFVRLQATWAAVAPATRPRGFRPANPSDPGYSWAAVDSGVRASTIASQHVVLEIVVAPAWATGPHPPASAPPGTWRPSPSALAAFATAVATRYSGTFPDPLHPGQMLPRVSYFQIWNEPNLPNYLTPQWVRNRGGGWSTTSPSLYRQLLNAAYRAIKSVQPSAFVLAAGTAPYGDQAPGPRMPPVLFLREMLCLSGQALRAERCPNPAHFDAYDHPPPASTPGVSAQNPDDVSVPNLGRLTRVLRVAVRTGRALPARPKPIWVTEMAWSSNPPDPLAIPIARQARYLSQAFYELWRQGVTHVFWLLIRDVAYKSLTGSGLYFASGKAKPSARAFAFPFVALGGHRGLTLWGRAPHAGTVTIERGNGHGWVPVAHLRTTSGGIFYATGVHLGAGRILRARLGSSASLGWTR